MQIISILIFADMLLGMFGVPISLIATIHLLLKRRESNTAWTISLASIVAFVYSGFYTVGDGITMRWANILGPPAGYFLLILALWQYRKDKLVASKIDNLW